MISEDDYLMLSALQHYAYCKRQCALIHLEQAWAENRFTAEGRVMHEAAHEEGTQVRAGVRIERSLSLLCRKLGLTGKSDVVEFHRSDDGVWVPFPVEYKRGKPKPDDCDIVQLTAQALCLEEMLQVPIPCGALFYGKTRHRLDVTFSLDVRERTEKIVADLRALLQSGITPHAEYGKKCESCSLIDVCMPQMSEKHRSVSEYMRTMTQG